MERILSKDYMYSFWMAAGGNTFWLVEREKTLLLFMILGNQSFLVCPFVNYDKTGIEMVMRIFGTMGFKEFAVHSEFKFMDSDLKKVFYNQLEMFDKAQKKATADRLNSQREQQARVRVEPSPQAEKTESNVVEMTKQ